MAQMTVERAEEVDGRGGDSNSGGGEAEVLERAEYAIH